MCGIFGITIKNNYRYRLNYLKNDINKLFTLSESRGKEASGISINNNHYIKVLKNSISPSKLIKTHDYNHLIDKEIKKKDNENFCIIGHSRLVTNGSQQIYDNNQPVINDNIIGIHNGIIVNNKRLWNENKGLKRNYEIDSEIIFALIENLMQSNKSVINSVLKTFDLIVGQASIASLFTKSNMLLLYTNNGSIYFATNNNNDIGIFASEKVFLNKLLKAKHFKSFFDSIKIIKISPNSGYLINLKDLYKQKFDIKKNNYKNLSTGYNKKVVLINKPSNQEIQSLALNNDKSTINIPSTIFKHQDKLYNRILNIRRCSKCILPISMPFIEYDNDGICNYCKDYVFYTIKDINALKKIINNQVDKNEDPNCLMSLSGGRDSSFGLHFAVKELNLKPIAYTYDWGLVTDLARRNISRMCGHLGLEHVVISADINKKRKFVRQKVLSWLKEPKLGLIPLFQSGDKQYFYYMKKVLKDNELDFILYTENPLEKTNFKSGFGGIFEGNNSKSRVYNMPLRKKIGLGLYFFKEFILNPTYFNNSLFDTYSGYLSSFFIRHDWTFLYEYYLWNETEVNNVLIDNYGWETAKDSSSTWRIGDGTAPFYNYIYYTVAGFTENDTLRSNQIREGFISRNQALEKVMIENQPRWDAIKWYCDTIKIDFIDTITAINKMEKIY